MNCLIDYVGVKGCDATTPASNLWINDFPGMSSELLQKISTPEQQGFLGLWQGIQRAAYEAIKTDVQSAVYGSGDAVFEQVLFSTRNQFVQQWLQVEALDPDAVYRGCLVSIQGSKYMGLRINHLRLYNAADTAAENIPVKICQSQDTKVLWSDTVTLQPGMNEIEVNEVFYSDFDKINIVLLVDCTNFTTAQNAWMDYGNNLWWGDIECQTRFSNLWWNGFSVYPVEAPLNYGIGHNWSMNTNQNGIYFSGDLICSIDLFICRQREYLKRAWALQLCYMTLWTKLSSNNGNYFAQNNRELTERNMATYEQQYKDALAMWAKQLNLKREGLCFNCDLGALVSTGYIR